MKKNKTAREIAVELLTTIEKNQSYSNIQLHHAIEKNHLSTADIGLLTELTYGTIQRKMTLDYYLQPFLKKSKKLEKWVVQLLRITLYQLVFLEKIPDRAAVYEAVEIAKKNGHKGIASLVNGVLRSIQREGLPSLEQISDIVERLSIETSHPYWLVKRWNEQFGLEKTKAMCEVNLTAPLQTARVNTTKITRDELMLMLEEEGFPVEKSLMVPEGIKCLKGNIANSSAFKQGYLTIQDESSMLTAYAVNPSNQDIILDACAAPGGKSTHLAEKLNQSGKVISLDLHEHKVKLIKQNAARLGLNNIDTKTMDSRKVGEVFSAESFDRILLDAPCSGLGVIRRKPDIKYSKAELDISKLADIQRTLLSAVVPLLKKGGTLVYSTCTIDHEENKQMVDFLLNEFPEFEQDLTLIERMPKEVQPFVHENQIQIFPQDFGSDGFYIACFRKKAE